ncbi:MAG: hypothetical protein RL291_1836, partial [Pseudomonadota bacterium]
MIGGVKAIIVAFAVSVAGMWPSPARSKDIPCAQSVELVL